MTDKLDALVARNEKGAAKWQRKYEIAKKAGDGAAWMRRIVKLARDNARAITDLRSRVVDAENLLSYQAHRVSNQRAEIQKLIAEDDARERIKP